MSFFSKLKIAIKRITGSKENRYKEQELEDAFIEADFGVALAERFSKKVCSSENIDDSIRTEVSAIIGPLIRDFVVTQKPYIIVLCGVNGGGKTTTVAKIAYLLKSQGYSVDIAACDTFRAAATEQLSVWAKRLDCRVFKSDHPRDPASVAFEAVSQTKSDVLIVDTAGRLHNNTNLMNELGKIYRVIAKQINDAPHENIIVLDSTIGQSAIEQVREFAKVKPLTGVILTKLDGNSKGGVIVRIAEEFKLPIKGVGVGEKESDFEKFSIEKFLSGLTKV
ncbi:MAG: signal recognition particle-docking protein FtsY [Alphaproteobacteria bacterium]|nr:signal recognition particle-docking protein FtsY [Alphaproteobacteria bacterium]